MPDQKKEIKTSAFTNSKAKRFESAWRHAALSGPRVLLRSRVLVSRWKRSQKAALENEQRPKQRHQQRRPVPPRNSKENGAWFPPCRTAYRWNNPRSNGSSGKPSATKRRFTPGRR